MEYINLLDVIANKNIIRYRFETSEKIKQCLNSAYMDECKISELIVEYPQGVNVDVIPSSIKAIPFVGVMFGICLIFDGIIKCYDLDREFFDSINKQIDVFQNLYQFQLYHMRVICEKKANFLKGNCEGAALLFTGGVDATSALASTSKETTELINIYGGDILLSDVNSQNYFVEYAKEISRFFGLTFSCIKSNCRELFREPTLDNFFLLHFVGEKEWHGYWASIGHVIAMVSVTAPLLWDRKINKCYLGSTYSKNEVSFDANHIDVISNLSFFGCKVIQKDSDLTRIEKIRKIAKFEQDSRYNISLSVCWNKTNGKNCCKCEKCLRTIMEIEAAGENPYKFGFDVTENTYNDVYNLLLGNRPNPSFWGDIIKEINNRNMTDDCQYRWIKEYDMQSDCIFFPPYNLKEKKKIIVYGAGKVGQSYIKWIIKYYGCLVMWVDQNWKSIHMNEAIVMAPEEIICVDYDEIWIAIDDLEIRKQIKEYLIKSLGINVVKIKDDSPKHLYGGDKFIEFGLQ